MNELDKRLADVGEFIKNQREVARMSLRRLAEVADVSNPYLSQIERGLRKPSADILQQIARALKISAETLYERAGILDADAASRPGVRDAIAADPLLSTDQRQALLNVYESFIAAAAPSAPPAPPPARKRSAAAAASTAGDEATPAPRRRSR